MAKYVAKPRTVDMIIDDKLDVLEDFAIVNNNNRSSIRDKFVKVLEEYGNSDAEIIIDNVARTLIKEFVYY